MTEPVLTPAATTLAAATATVPMLSAFGVNLGLRPDFLVAGFFGALIAIVLLNSVPAGTDTWREMLGGTVHRMLVAVASSVFAGYVTPLFALIEQIPSPMLLSVACVLGAGAQKILAAFVRRFERSAGGSDAPRGEG